MGLATLGSSDPLQQGRLEAVSGMLRILSEKLFDLEREQ